MNQIQASLIMRSEFVIQLQMLEWWGHVLQE